MSERQADLVIQISASEECSGATTHNPSGDDGLASELRRRLEPGAEIALTCDGYVAIASVIWIADGPLDRTFHAGVRLLAVSNLPDGGTYH
jgi:hypothetical protein